MILREIEDKDYETFIPWLTKALAALRIVSGVTKEMLEKQIAEGWRVVVGLEENKYVAALRLKPITDGWQIRFYCADPDLPPDDQTRALDYISYYGCSSILVAQKLYRVFAHYPTQCAQVVPGMVYLDDMLKMEKAEDPNSVSLEPGKVVAWDYDDDARNLIKTILRRRPELRKW